MEYVYVEGSRLAGDATAVGERVYELSHQSLTGQCPPEAYVADAQDPESPLYATITHDRDTAAYKYNLHEARLTMKSLRLVIEGKVDSAPAFVSMTIVTDDGVSRGYVATREIASKDLQGQVLADALLVLNGWRRRFAHLNALQPVWDALDQISTETKV